MRRCRITMSSLILVLLTVFTGAVSCTKEFDFGFKELCFYHPHTAPIKVNVDWGSFRHIEQPTGMTVYVWPQDSTKEISRFVTHDLDAVTLDLVKGRYDAFVFNQSDTEYATIEFHNLHDFDLAEARVMQMKSSWKHYSTKAPDTKVGLEPEWLALDCLEDIEVTEAMVERAEREFLEGKARAKAKAKSQGTKGITKTQNEVGSLVPKSIIKKLDIYIHIENIYFLSSAIATIDGLAEGCYISSGRTTAGQVAHPIDTWSLTHDKDESGEDDLMKGYIKTSITTFGTPDGHRGLFDENNLFVEFLLVDKKTILSNNFYIGDLIKDLNTYDGTQIDENGEVIWPEIHLDWPEPLPIVIPEGETGGGFDVGVSGWDEDEVVTVIPLN